MDFEVKARKANREFSSAEYVRIGPPGPVLTLLRSMPPTTGLVVGARGELSCSAKQFESDCAKTCPSYDRKLYQLRLWRVLLARRGSGPIRGTRSYRGLEAVHHWPLGLGGYAGGRERVGLDWRPGSGRVHLPSASAGGGAVLGWQLT